MTALLLTGISSLVTNDPQRGGLIGELLDAAVVIEGSTFAWVGSRTEAPAADEALDLGGRAVIPGFVDSHSHLVFAGDRAEEFAARMTGQPYSAGGIRTTVAATRQATDEQLTANVARLVAEMRRQGTTTVEIKSGYGLTVADEARALALAGGFTGETTYLGAHVVPVEYAEDPAGYVDLVTGPMLEAAAPYAKWVDVFVERGAFDEDQARAILLAGKAKGLGLRVHANQLRPGPGVRLACELGAAAADHCTHLTREDVDALASTGVVAGLLPAVEFSTRSPYPDARRLIDAGV
ncbi:MAG TPA: imidazolonepropionase, partial [Kribbellaceae bacterium]